MSQFQSNPTFSASENDAEIVLVPVPWDITAPYKKGAAETPEKLIQAKTYTQYNTSKHARKICMLPVSAEWQKINRELTPEFIEWMDFFESNPEKYTKTPAFQELIKYINAAQQALTANLREKCTSLLQKNKKIGILGGDQSTALGLVQAIDQQVDQFGLLHLDAFSDSEAVYPDFPVSSSSFIRNCTETCRNLTTVVQAGIRHFPEEFPLDSSVQFYTYSSGNLSDWLYQGEAWKTCCQKIIENLPEKVYLSLDFRVLDVAYCPECSLASPGIFTPAMIRYLVQELGSSGRTIVGFDLSEAQINQETTPQTLATFFFLLDSITNAL